MAEVTSFKSSSKRTTQRKLSVSLYSLFLQMCEDARLSDKRTYPTFSRTVSSPGRPVLAVLQHFNWSWVGLITEDSVDWRERGANIQRTLVSNNVTVRLQRVIPSIKDYTANKTALQLTKVLQDMREVCRGRAGIPEVGTAIWKRSWMLVVPLRGQNLGLWYRLGWWASGATYASALPLWGSGVSKVNKMRPLFYGS